MSKKKSADAGGKVHPWRLCEIGSHWVREHIRTTPKGNVVTVRAHCARNPSGTDRLTVDEIAEITERQFGVLKGGLCSSNIGYGRGSEFDSIILGWTQYWNEVLAPDEPLDPNIVKALIASESSFNPKAKTKSGGLNVRGLMQIRDDTRKIVGDVKGEMKRGYISAQPDDLWDPSVNISIGIRWLFRKRQIVRAKNPQATWRDAVAAYKAFAPSSKDMENFDESLKKLRECK